MTYKRLTEDESEHEYYWYAHVNEGWKDKKDITFVNWNPVDWKRFEAYYNGSNDSLTFDSDATYHDKNKVKNIREFIKFIDSDQFKELVIDPDATYDEYIFELHYDY